MAEGKPARSYHRIMFRTAGFVTAPLFILLLLFLLGAVNPMATSFLPTFEVANKTDETLIITPIGAIGEHGIRSTLPMSVSGKLSWPASKVSHFRINPGSSHKFHYDWDDIQFCEILVENDAGMKKKL